jgi:hypothetical protein
MRDCGQCPGSLDRGLSGPAWQFGALRPGAWRGRGAERFEQARNQPDLQSCWPSRALRHRHPSPSEVCGSSAHSIRRLVALEAANDPLMITFTASPEATINGSLPASHTSRRVTPLVRELAPFTRYFDNSGEACDLARRSCCFHPARARGSRPRGTGATPCGSPYIPRQSVEMGHWLRVAGLILGAQSLVDPGGIPFGIDIACACGLACLAKHARLCRCRLAKTHFVLS